MVTFDGVPSYMEYYEAYKNSDKPAGEGIVIDGVNDLDPTDPYENAYLQWPFPKR